MERPAKASGKVRIELDGLFEKRLSLQRRVAKHVPPVGVIVCLDEEQIGVRILGWPVIEPRFFIWRKFRLKSRGNFLREIGLDGEDVGQIAVVIFRPNVLVVVRVDQLHAHSDAIADPTDAAFQKRGYAQRFANFAGVAHAIATIRHDRHARDDLQIADLRKIRQDIVLHAVGEVGVLLFIAEALKGQDGNRLLDVAPEARGNRKNPATAETITPIAISMIRLRRRCVPGSWAWREFLAE